MTITTVQRQAYYAVRKSIANGDLLPSPICMICGDETTTIAHHPNYDYPTLVTWLCNKCHRLFHHNNPTNHNNQNSRVKSDRNQRLYQYHLQHPKMSYAKLGRIFTHKLNGSMKALDASAAYRIIKREEQRLESNPSASGEN